MEDFIETTAEFLLTTIKRTYPTTWLLGEFPLIRVDGMAVFDLVDDAITQGVARAAAGALSTSTADAPSQAFQAVFQAIADRAAEQAFVASAN